jgi:uncharacterized protein (DUF1499 family)
VRRKIWIRLGIAGAVLVGLFFISLAVQSAMAKRPTNLGIVEGRLRACPATPNCVCTHDGDEQHQIEPLTFAGTSEAAIAKLKAVIEATPRTKIVTAESHYLHVEFTTLVMRFVDDVEFMVDPEHKTIHFRSASRVGYSDLSVNRRRMETIRRAFDEP